MKTFGYFAIAVFAVGACGAAFAQKTGPERVAQVPRAMVNTAAPCLARDIPSLSMNSDFSVFFEPNCPAGIREQALHRLWRVLPQPDGEVGSAY